jgi:hypothetical protein
MILTGVRDLPEDEEALIRRQRAYVFFKEEGFDTILTYLKRLTGNP